MSVGIQIDGSDRAKAIATSVLSGISDLWQELTELIAPNTQAALAKAHEAIVRGRADMIDAAREDFGG